MASKKKAKKPGPRFDRPEILREVCEWIGDGKTVRDYCRQDGKPCYQTVYEWLNETEGTDDDMTRRFARSKRAGYDAIASDCLGIADDGTNDYMERENKDGSSYTVLDTEHVQRSKLRIDTRLKLLAKWDPGRYGEKTKIEHEGALTLTQLVEGSYTQTNENAEPVDGGE